MLRIENIEWMTDVFTAQGLPAVVYKSEDFFYKQMPNGTSSETTLTNIIRQWLSKEYHANCVGFTYFCVEWNEYLEYLQEWIEDHRDFAFRGCSPAGYDEWLNNEE